MSVDRNVHVVYSENNVHRGREVLRAVHCFTRELLGVQRPGAPAGQEPRATG